MTPWPGQAVRYRADIRQEVPGGPMSWQYLAEGPPLTGGDRGVVVVVAVIALAALAVGYVLLKEVLAAGQGTSAMPGIAKAGPEGGGADRALTVLPRRRRVLVLDRLPRHVARPAGHPARRRRCPGAGRARGRDARGVPPRRRGRHVHRRPRPVRCLRRRPGVGRRGA